MNKALVLIDIQNIYFTEGPYKLYKPEECADNILQVLEYFRKNNLPIIHVKHNFKVPGEKKEYLNSIYESVSPKENEEIVEKNYPNSFLKTNLKDILDKYKVDELVVAGMMSHMCIDTSVRAAMNYGYKVKLIGDGCTTMDLKYEDEIIKAEIVTKTIIASLNGMFAEIVSYKDFK